ncbi:ABC transporter permease [Nocardioides dongxiaopingii]|uniref:ABC transporter permease n=1 Tax=Nocardioides TaxID=1839 RepID=UPI0010C77074|nr:MULTISPECIES: ABC transporter permease [Nocardioides]QCW49562.1 ABC transporter permease [Nocardioides sp. S-1144]
MSATDRTAAGPAGPGDPVGTDRSDPPGWSWRERRPRTLAALVVAVAVVVAIVVAGTLAAGPASVTDLPERHLAPSREHLLGTDRYGRDLLLRVLVGLRLSLLVGALAALISGAVALALALVAAVGGPWAEAVVAWLVDLFLALPHLVLLILVAFALGGGTGAVVVAVGITHWPRLTLVLLATARRTVRSDYVALSRGLGHGRVHVARHHLAGQLVPHLSVGVVLMFPHAILHEAALSFLGLGIDPGQPAIGVLLDESMRSLSAGYWWLAVLPGVALLLVVKLVDRIGDDTRLLLDPRSHHL